MGTARNKRQRYLFVCLLFLAVPFVSRYPIDRRRSGRCMRRHIRRTGHLSVFYPGSVENPWVHRTHHDGHVSESILLSIILIGGSADNFVWCFHIEDRACTWLFSHLFYMRNCVGIFCFLALR